MSRLIAVAVLALGLLVSAGAAATAEPVLGRDGVAVAVSVSTKRHGTYLYREDVSFIANPAGCKRVSLSCACRLAAYLGLGSGLDKVSTWPRVFARAHGPAVGLAAVRRDQHHIMGIIGGGPGAWRVADFNSGGHRNREYTVADFRGYFFVDPRTRVASR